MGYYLAASVDKFSPEQDSFSGDALVDDFAVKNPITIPTAKNTSATTIDTPITTLALLAIISS